jgi:hypothetical protein
MKGFIQTKRPASASYPTRSRQLAQVAPQPAPAKTEPSAQAAQLERAARSGYSLARISIASPGRGNHAGLPAPLKAGIKGLSGLSMDDVRVHYNSPRPAALQALAQTRGRDIYVGPGQEKHLPHEAWHVVQQKQGRVKPTVEAMGVPINDEEDLEKEADAMGGKATQLAESAPEEDDEEELSAPENDGESLAVQMKQVTQLARPRGRVPGERTIRVPGVRQKDSNLCWAATGWSIHRYKRGTAYATEQDFVNGQAKAYARGRYTANKPTDIDRIIGSLSNTDRFSGEDSVRPFTQGIITREINRRHPIVAHVNGDHYIIISGYRTRNRMYQLQRMDPATGRTAWVNTTRAAGYHNPHISKAGAYTLYVLYYIK